MNNFPGLSSKSPFIRFYQNENQLISKAQDIFNQLGTNLREGVISKELYDKAVNQFKDLIQKGGKKGEGSKGGKVIGHTKSGKPIYGLKRLKENTDWLDEDSHKESHKHFTPEEHEEAADLYAEEVQKRKEKGHNTYGADSVSQRRNTDYSTHKEIEKWHRDRAKATKEVTGKEVHEKRGFSEKNGDEDVTGKEGVIKSDSYDILKGGEESRKGEGSRGGKIIGHTKSGKPIYDSPSHQGHASFDKNDHEDARKLHDELQDFHRKKETEAVDLGNTEAAAHQRKLIDSHMDSYFEHMRAGIAKEKKEKEGKEGRVESKKAHEERGFSEKAGDEDVTGKVEKIVSDIDSEVGHETIYDWGVETGVIDQDEKWEDWDGSDREQVLSDVVDFVRDNPNNKFSRKFFKDHPEAKKK